MLRTLYSEVGTGAVISIDFYRNPLYKPFSATERLLVDMILPHLFQAHSLCLSLRNTDQANVPRLGTSETAICDERGSIISMSNRFMSLMQEEWPEASETHLPNGITEEIQQRYKVDGDGVRVSWLIKPLGKYYTVSLKHRNCLSVLPPHLALVAKLLGNGLSYKEIARIRSVSPSTVTNQANEIYKRLHVRNKAELARIVSHLDVG